MMTSREDAMNAVSTLLKYIEGDDAREGLVDTPKRVVESFSEIYAGYDMNAEDVLSSTFNGEGYDGIVLLRDIEMRLLANTTFNPSEVGHMLHTYQQTELWELAS